MASTVCNWIFIIFLLLYIAALVLLIIGTFGLFGQEQDPLSGIFLLPLGLPWNQFLGFLGDTAKPWAAAAAPLINLIILRIICMRLG